MTIPAFLRELGQLIKERAVISCVYPRLVALETVQEIAGLTFAQPGLITTSAKEVLKHVELQPAPSLLFVSEHLVDGDGPSLVREIHQNGGDQRSVLIITDNHQLSPDVLTDPIFSSIVIDQNIGGSSCILTQALRAVNRNERFLDPGIEQNSLATRLNDDPLSLRELDVLGLVAEGLSNKQVAERLHLASTTVRDHLQSVMRKLNVNSRTGAAVAGFRKGLLAGISGL
jgi:DNA-binding NarL/FixJ family response regulator